MTQPGIEPRSPGLIWPMARYKVDIDKEEKISIVGN